MTAKVSGKTATRLRTPAQMSQAVTPEASRPLRKNPNLLCYFPASFIDQQRTFDFLTLKMLEDFPRSASSR